MSSLFQELTDGVAEDVDGLTDANTFWITELKINWITKLAEDPAMDSQLEPYIPLIRQLICHEELITENL